MIIFRYLIKEVSLTLLALTAILLLIFLSNQFVQYLNRIATGTIPAMILMKLMALELPNLLGLLLPLGFYMALLLAYGRLYAEHEMTILRACGYGPNQLLAHSFIMASFVAVLVGLMIIWVNPHIALARAKLLRTTGIQTVIQTIMPGRFHSIHSGQQVFYVQSISRDHGKASQVFIAKKSNKNNKENKDNKDNKDSKDSKGQWDILWADNAYAETDPKTSDEYLVLHDGKTYRGIPGQADYQLAQFIDYKTRLPHPTIKSPNEDLRTASIGSLWPLNNPNLEKAAELQWRISIPLTLFTLTLIAVPLSRVNARSGKFAQLLPAVLIYILYANFMFVARDATALGKIPVWIGMWWVHLVVIILGLLLIWRNQVKLA